MIKVLIVDDSALVRQILTAILGREADIVVVGQAADPLIARDRIKELNPDVLTLDVEMPRMDGLEFLEKLMRLRPMPVVMVSSLTERGADVTLRALELGAVDFVTKPKLGVAEGLEEYAQEIVAKIRAAARSQVRKRSAGPHVPLVVPSSIKGASEKLILLGASTGGTEAIKDVLLDMPPSCPPIVIVQHMPAGFTASFAKRLDGLCRISVKEAQSGERIVPGHAYIAPGGRHLVLKRSGAFYLTELNDDEPMSLHRPSVDKLFHSAVPNVGANAVAVLLTGMGKDGAQGMLALKQKGVYTVAQDEASCVVFGMPREAIQLGAADAVLDLGKVAEHVLARFGAMAR
ncbi:protein-glutamate methylesterase/protein-glutamine glutaminase [Uliginosibacterium aquaticum]|uniref:Protein-glutamate methylesterase/protein-glutamine glutaminase n=1 Tax=Uliginosibacterium aquaticum TaxID=2731212 RepID=A0ABX2IQ32_9RHOO|nr:chemotaxis response regulator protein-glutamate methylesterase [Uliginosibacterium aquaticum]NSL56411.1 chemotaxis response regulator protein-glutamate methylesterase [Uliginosibacterium aquaticum]